MYQASIVGFYLQKVDLLYADLPFRQHILKFKALLHTDAYNQQSEKQQFEYLLKHYLEEAALTISLLSAEQFSKTDPILELGGGIGLSYAFLKTQGFNVHALEPSDAGYGDYYDIGKRLCDLIGVSTEHWYPYLGKDVGKTNKKFKLIFSNNVLEHILDLETTLQALGNVLLPAGRMIHNTVNYNIPYEPHYKIPLVPFFPKKTVWFKPSLKQDELWQGLHFITSGRLRKMSNRCGLKIVFEKGILYRTLLRLDSDPEFAKRQAYFLPIYRILKATRLLQLLKYLPASIATPIRFTLEKA